MSQAMVSRNAGTLQAWPSSTLRFREAFCLTRVQRNLQYRGIPVLHTLLVLPFAKSPADWTLYPRYRNTQSMLSKRNIQETEREIH